MGTNAIDLTRCTRHRPPNLGQSGFSDLQIGQVRVILATDLNDRAVDEQLPTWGVLVIESHHSAKFTMDWRTHRFIKIIFVLRGSGTFHLGNREQSFTSGDVAVVRPGVRNRIVDQPGAASSLYVACVDTELVRFDATLVNRIETRVVHADAHFANRVAAMMRRLVHAQDSRSEDRPIAMVADALKLVHWTVNASMLTDRRRTSDATEPGDVQHYIDTLPTRFFEETTIDEVADSLNLSRRSFTQTFQQLTGETWLNHIRGLAIDHARRRLSETELPIVSIAFECGFNDLSTFYRQFKKRCGISPAKYRAKS